MIKFWLICFVLLMCVGEVDGHLITVDSARMLIGGIKNRTHHTAPLNLLTKPGASYLNYPEEIALGGLLMLLIIAGLAYHGSRIKKRSNIELQNKQIEINLQNIKLSHLIIENTDLVTEKNWLLKEVHHRVKNNLQIVMSLLNTQSAYLKNKEAITAIRENQNRVQAIALIHQKLYNTGSVTSIGIAAYVDDLIDYLSDCFSTAKRGIRFKQVVENFSLDLVQAVPLGLILNEAITNAIKYAFDEDGGQIVIGLQIIGQDKALLTIADNGRGLPTGFDMEIVASLGMEMIKALSKQLRGEIQVRSDLGTYIGIEFQIEKVIHSLPVGGLLPNNLSA